MKLDLDKTRIIVCAWPDQRWPVELMGWVKERFWQRPLFGMQSVVSRSIQNVVCARNSIILYDCLNAPKAFEWFIFCDHDVRPDARADEMFSLETDIRCCQVEMDNPTAWHRPDSFHDALWCCHRSALEKMPHPWFAWKFNAYGTSVDGCLCESFRKNALSHGLTIGHAGYAIHDRDGSCYQ